MNANIEDYIIFYAILKLPLSSRSLLLVTSYWYPSKALFITKKAEPPFDPVIATILYLAVLFVVN